MEIEITWEGIGAAIAALDEIEAKLIANTEAGVEEGGRLVQEAARGNILLNFVQRTGELYASTYWWPSGEFEVRIAPHTIYGRHQELGGWSIGNPYLRFPGMNVSVLQPANIYTTQGGGFVYARATYLPPRPYLRPALEEETGPYAQEMYDEWAEAWSV